MISLAAVFRMDENSGNTGAETIQKFLKDGKSLNYGGY